jgi:hypothetical protein
MVHFANKNISERELLVGDMVYLKVQPVYTDALNSTVNFMVHLEFWRKWG